MDRGSRLIDVRTILLGNTGIPEKL